MKRKQITILVLAIVVLFLSSCNKKSIELNNTLLEQYDFYEKSVTKIINTMDISSQQADTIFLTLVGLGLDKEIVSIFRHGDQFNLFISNKYVSLYLENGELEKITDTTNQILYPIPDTITQESDEPETQENTTTIIAEQIPLEITGHYFKEDDVYGYKEIQLFIEFNRALSKQELGIPTSPTYTYKYFLSTKEGDNFIVDCSGISLSNVYFNKDFTEYELASSGNGMREGRYSSDPFFNQNNITSIKIELYKKTKEDTYSHDYELIHEYFYSVDNENLEETTSSS